MAEIIWRSFAWCRTGLARILAKVVSSCFGDQLGEVGEGMTSQGWREDLARLLSRRFGRWVGVFGERLWRECSPRRFVGVGVDVGGTLARLERSRVSKRFDSVPGRIGDTYCPVSPKIAETVRLG